MSAIDGPLEPRPDPEPPEYYQPSGPCPCCGYMNPDFLAESWWEDYGFADERAVYQVTDCPRCRYSPEDHWDGTEEDWRNQAEGYRDGWLKWAAEDLANKCDVEGELFLYGCSRRTGGDAEAVDAAIDAIQRAVQDVYGMCHQLGTIEGCRKLANE